MYVFLSSLRGWIFKTPEETENMKTRYQNIFLKTVTTNILFNEIYVTTGKVPPKGKYFSVFLYLHLGSGYCNLKMQEKGKYVKNH